MGVTGSAETRIQLGDVAMTLGPGVRINGMQKVYFCADASNAIAVAGASNVHGKHLSANQQLAGFECADALERSMRDECDFRALPAMKETEVPSHAALHAFRSEDRFIVTKVEASRISSSRVSIRSSPGQVKLATIGSGFDPLQYLLVAAPIAAQFGKLRDDADNLKPEDLRAFLARAFPAVAAFLPDVSVQNDAWLLTGAGDWVKME